MAAQSGLEHAEDLNGPEYCISRPNLILKSTALQREQQRTIEQVRQEPLRNPGCAHSATRPYSNDAQAFTGIWLNCKSIVRQELRQMHRDGLEPATFGSVVASKRWPKTTEIARLVLFYRHK